MSGFLGIDGLMLNRFNPGGEGMRHIDELLPSLEDMKAALEIANQFAKEYRLSISCSIAIHPCLIDTSPFFMLVLDIVVQVHTDRIMPLLNW